MRLFCLPNAGGSQSMYYKWEEYLEPLVNLYPIELKGRGKRYKEAFYENIEEAVEDIYNLMKDEIDKSDYAIYGHSMGSLLAYELYYKIEKMNKRRPKHIFFSGYAAPNITQKRGVSYDLSDDEFEKKILELKETPEELIHNKELVKFISPILKNDYKIIDNYKYRERENKISCDISIMNGKEDSIKGNQIVEWEKHTHKKCNIHTFTGDHFYINHNVENITKVIKSILLEKEYNKVAIKNEELNEKKYYNLTHPQKRIWYIEKINSNSPLHNIGGCLRINGNINFKILEKTLNLIIEKNPALRLRFTEKDGQCYQYVCKFNEEKIDFFDFAICEEPKKEFKLWSEKVFKRPFILEKKPLYYMAMFKVSEKECGFLVKMHHIISDGWSANLIQKQTCEIYSKLLRGEKIDSSEEYSYIDYIEKEKKYIESDRFLKNKLFWNEKFRDLPEELLYKSSDKLEGRRKSFNLDKELSGQIKDFLKDTKGSLNTFFMTLMLIYLNKSTEHNDIVIGTPVFNRSGKKDKNTIGMFTSTVPFRLKMNPNISVNNLINEVNSEIKGCFFNQKYPYDLLVSDLELKKKGYDGLFKICVNYYNTENMDKIDGIPVELEEYYNGNQNYSLQLIVKEWAEDESITLSFDYKTEDYSEEEILNMYKHILTLANKVLKNKDKEIKNVYLLDEDEFEEKVYTLNSTKTNYPKDKTIYELFQEQVKKAPNKIALNFKNKNLTYRELDERSNQLASYLIKKGIKKDSIVGIMAVHSFELVIGILGVMKAGGAYLPIDPNYPVERINYMLQDSKSSILLTNLQISSEIEFGGEILDLHNDHIWLESKENINKRSDINDLAYIIYTSGSTGKPKGVMIEHGGLVNYIWWASKVYLKEENDVFALYSSISFDLTVTSIFTPLICGNTIAVYADDDETEFVLYKILRENKATVVKLTPSHLMLLKDMDNSASNIKRFIVGGENLSTALAKEICDSFGENLEIYNEYGPTETVVGCMIYKFDPLKDKAVSVPIGVPSDNVQIYILDKYLNPVPTGIVGEMYISGDGVARGYLNREDLTKERFISNPFIKGKRMYKTGDTAKYLKNEHIEYVGRSDNQVKIRGHRIELGEIEKYLLENKCIRNALVIDRENNSGDKMLYAYLISEKEIDKLELKKWLSMYVPKYMIPADFIYLDEFPLTPNGKIDFKLLPEGKETEREFIKYRNHKEKKLVETFQEILGIDDISMSDNFYELGGDSIKAIQIASKLKNKGLEVNVKDILSHDFIEEIAADVVVSSEEETIDQNISSGTIKNTPIIEWFFSQNFKEKHHYNQSVLLECKKRLTVPEIQEAVKKLIEHHDTLRINYDKNSKVLYYNNIYLKEKINVDCFDLSSYTEEEQNKRIKELGYKIKASFNIEENLLFKVCIFDLGEKGQLLLFTAHHLIVDGVSWRILLEDFSTIIEQLQSNEDIVLPLKSHSFKEWSSQLQEYSKRINKGEEEYWTSVINSDFSYLIDHDFGQDYIKSSSTLGREIDVVLTKGLSKNIKKTYGMDINEELISALALTITEMTGQEDIIIELERHGREAINDEINTSRTIGWFTSMYPALLKVSREEVDANIKSLKKQLKNIPNKGFNFSILKYLNKTFSENEKKHIRFNYLGDFDNILKSDTFKVSKIDCGSEIGENNHLTALIDITAMIINKKLKLNITFSKNKFKEETIKEFMNKYIEKLNYLWDVKE